MPSLKIYVQDNGVYGCVVVVAPSREEAISIMAPMFNYFPDNSEILEYEISVGPIHVCVGDR